MAKFNIHTVVTDDVKQLAAQIKSVGRRVKDVNRDIHACAIGTVLHAAKSGDVTLMHDLCAVIGHAKAPLQKWYLKYGQVVIGTYKDKDGNEKRGLAYDKDKQDKVKDAIKKDRKHFIDTLHAEPFWELEPPKDFKGFILPDEIRNLIKRAESMHKKHPTEADKIDLTGIEELKALRTSLGMGSDDDSGPMGGEAEEGEQVAVH